MEPNLPHLDGCIYASACQPAALLGLGAVGQPQHGVDAPRHRILDRYVLQGLLDAPDVYVRIERTRGAVSRVRGPAQRVYACGMEGPAGGDRLALRDVVKDDFPT